MLQIKMEILQFIGQQGLGIQKLSKYWPLGQTIPMLQIMMEKHQLNFQCSTSMFVEYSCLSASLENTIKDQKKTCTMQNLDTNPVVTCP